MSGSFESVICSRRSRQRFAQAIAALAILILGPHAARAETGEAAWLRYTPLDDMNALRLYENLPPAIIALDTDPVTTAARDELMRGVGSMLGRTLRIETDTAAFDSILLGTTRSVQLAAPALLLPSPLIDDSYILGATGINGRRALLIAGPNPRGVLYGAFALLRKIALHQPLYDLAEQHSPQAAIRWTNEWDNLDGSIERGYAGRSLFFDGGRVVADLSRASDYARLLASVGINGCTVNNVNADKRILTPEFLPQLARLAAAFRPWGIRLSIAVDFGSPKTIGGLDTFDPLDSRVAAWWTEKADELYRAIPDLAGILLKADSEGKVGPSTYGRTHADAANVIAAALAPHGGVLVYRGFVYDHHMDWRNPKNDRARAAYDNFAKLDGKFAKNVLVQIKYGPIDFQVREPVSPLFGALPHTNQTIEFQVTQEYTGQQRHLCFLLPMWKQILDFDFHLENQPSPVKAIVSGQRIGQPLGGFVAVSNVGTDRNWLGYDLAMANLYAFGRIAWDPGLSARDIVDEWTRQTFGNNSEVVETIDNLQLRSWPVYEDYTGPLGAGGLTDIIGIHYGPGIESSERNGWGQWHRADHGGIGMDRTVATGTKFVDQYPAVWAARYESLVTTPDELLLFFHHVPYQHRLHSGQTVIQHIYDAHYRGAAEAQNFPQQWRSLRGLIDDDRYQAVLSRLTYQAGHSIVWRDAVCDWFRKTSGIPDGAGRVGNHPGRIEAESMQLKGYAPVDVTPWETASGGKAVVCSGQSACTAEARLDAPSGWYRVAVQYFAPNDGDALFHLYLNGNSIVEWHNEIALPSRKLDGHTSTRFVLQRLYLKPGDRFQIVGRPEGMNPAALDYVELSPR